MAPAPADKLSRIGVSILFKRQLPQSSRPKVEIAGPHHTVTTLAHFRTSKDGWIAQRPQPFEAMDRLSEINWQPSAVLPLQLQRVIVDRPYVRNADGVFRDCICSSGDSPTDRIAGGALELVPSDCRGWMTSSWLE
jgi:hypothetical protein